MLDECILTSTVARVTCGSRDDILGLLETSLRILQSALGLNLLGLPDLGMLAVVLNVLHLYINFWTVEWLILNN